MRQLGQMKKSTKNSLFTYTLVIAAFVVVQALRMGPGVGAMLEGQLILPFEEVEAGVYSYRLCDYELVYTTKLGLQSFKLDNED